MATALHVLVSDNFVNFGWRHHSAVFLSGNCTGKSSGYT